MKHGMRIVVPMITRNIKICRRIILPFLVLATSIYADTISSSNITIDGKTYYYYDGELYGIFEMNSTVLPTPEMFKYLDDDYPGTSTNVANVISYVSNVMDKIVGIVPSFIFDPVSEPSPVWRVKLMQNGVLKKWTELVVRVDGGEITRYDVYECKKTSIGNMQRRRIYRTNNETEASNILFEQLNRQEKGSPIKGSE